MLVNVHHESAWEHRRLLVAGVAFLTTIAVLIALSIAIYQKAFEDVTLVTIKADRAGLQLPQYGDIRDNGALVGQVREVAQDGEQASITLGFRPEAAERIPSNISVQILPTTLFGQKFVSVVRPEESSGESLQDGDVIPATRVETNVELNRVLSDLFPLLRSVNPADLNATLNALATALDGRGEQLGRTLDELDSYLGTVQQQLPTLRKDLEKVAEVARAYDVAAPDLIGVLRNVTVTSRTLQDQRQQLQTFFSSVTGVARTGTRVLRENEQNLIRVGEVTAPIMRLLATYSPEFPCLLRGAEKYEPVLSKTFEGNEVKQYVEFGTPQYEAYDEDDKPTYGEVGHGPWCAGLPNPPIPTEGYPLDQGSSIDENPPQSQLPPSMQGGAGSPAAGSGYGGTPGERKVVTALLADETGRSVDSFGAVSAMMYAPLVREQGVDS